MYIFEFLLSVEDYSIWFARTQNKITRITFISEILSNKFYIYIVFEYIFSQLYYRKGVKKHMVFLLNLAWNPTKYLRNMYMGSITTTNKRLKPYHIIIHSHYKWLAKPPLLNQKKKLLVVQFIKLNLVFLMIFSYLCKFYLLNIRVLYLQNTFELFQILIYNYFYQI